MFIVICGNVCDTIHQISTIGMDCFSVFGPFETREDAEYYVQTEMNRFCDHAHYVLRVVHP